MKKLISIISLAFILCFPINIVKASEPKISPTAGIYTEGIYHFSKSTGNQINLTLSNLDEPMNVIIIDKSSNSLKYFLNFTKDNSKVSIDLYKPLEEHTVIIEGKGEIAFSFI